MGTDQHTNFANYDTYDANYDTYDANADALADNWRDHGPLCDRVNDHEWHYASSALAAHRYGYLQDANHEMREWVLHGQRYQQSVFRSHREHDRHQHQLEPTLEQRRGLVQSVHHELVDSFLRQLPTDHCPFLGWKFRE